MSEKKRAKYLTKHVKFNGEEVTLYSIDGNTWSTRRQELLDIIQRHENERAALGQMVGEAREAAQGGEEDKEETDKAEEEEGAEIDEGDIPRKQYLKSSFGKGAPPKGDDIDESEEEESSEKKGKKSSSARETKDIGAVRPKGAPKAKPSIKASKPPTKVASPKKGPAIRPKKKGPAPKGKKQAA